jgi:hypothetical protein
MSSFHKDTSTDPHHTATSAHSTTSHTSHAASTSTSAHGHTSGPATTSHEKMVQLSSKQGESFNVPASAAMLSGIVARMVSIRILYYIYELIYHSNALD